MPETEIVLEDGERTVTRTTSDVPIDEPGGWVCIHDTADDEPAAEAGAVLTADTAAALKLKVSTATTVAQLRKVVDELVDKLT